MKLRVLRILLAGASFTLLTLFFLGLVGGCGWLADWQFVPALLACGLGAAIVAVVTALFGRVYCSTFCPFGVLQDVLLRCVRLFWKRPFAPSPDRVVVRSVLLAAFTALVVVNGVSVAGLIEPYSVFGRIVSQVLHPLADGLNNLLADAFGTDGAVVLFKREVVWQGLAGLTVALTSLVLLAGLVAWKGRVFCNTVCPVGAMLAVLSRGAAVRLVIDPAKCVKCGLCSRVCKAECLDGRTQTLDNARCVRCFDCVATCPHGAIAFRPRPPWRLRPEELSASRRAFVGSTIGVAALGCLWTKDRWRGHAVADAVAAIPPPGASVDSLRAHCTACGLCVARCPSQVLTPAGFSDYGPLGVLMPKMDFTHGFCRPDCTVCGEVCPTGAIPSLTVEAKKRTTMGVAVWDRAACLVCTEKLSCGLCARRCPHGAISLKSEETVDAENKKTTVEIPVVDKAKCRGCGACEQYCPSQALRVRRG